MGFWCSSKTSTTQRQTLPPQRASRICHVLTLANADCDVSCSQSTANRNRPTQIRSVERVFLQTTNAPRKRSFIRRRFATDNNAFPTPIVITKICHKTIVIRQSGVSTLSLLQSSVITSSTSVPTCSNRVHNAAKVCSQAPGSGAVIGSSLT